MKKTLRTMMLAAAGVVGNVAVAYAQPAPPPPPPPGDSGQPAPPPVEFGVAPAALPAQPVSNTPVPTVSWGAQPSGDTTTPTAATPEKKQNPFFFTRFTWGNAGTTSMFGIGKDFQGSDNQRYDMDFTLNLRYYAINLPLDKLYINASLGVTTELTNSDTTTNKRQPYFKDLPISVGYTHTVFRNADKTISTAPIISVGYGLPTSVQSRAAGKYGSLSVSGGLLQLLPIAGPKSDWFSDIYLIGVAGWSHYFSNGTTPVNGNYNAAHPRQGLDPIEDPYQDSTGGAFLTHDVGRLNFTYYLTIYKDLSLGNTWEVVIPAKYTGSGDHCVQIATGCVSIGASDPGSLNPTTTFDIGLSYLLFNTARIDLGYTNTTLALDDNQGHRRSVFYGPDATFYGNVSIYIDTILDKALHLTDEQKNARALAGGRMTRGAL